MGFDFAEKTKDDVAVLLRETLNRFKGTKKPTGIKVVKGAINKLKKSYDESLIASVVSCFAKEKESKIDSPQRFVSHFDSLVAKYEDISVSQDELDAWDVYRQAIDDVDCDLIPSALLPVFRKAFWESFSAFGDMYWLLSDNAKSGREVMALYAINENGNLGHQFFLNMKRVEDLSLTKDRPAVYFTHACFKPTVASFATIVAQTISDPEITEIITKCLKSQLDEKQ